VAKFKREIHRVNFPGGVANVVPMPYLKKLQGWTIFNVKTVFTAIVKFLKFDLA
jgi:hypothetical protein